MVLNDEPEDNYTKDEAPLPRDNLPVVRRLRTRALGRRPGILLPGLDGMSDDCHNSCLRVAGRTVALSA